MYWQAILVIFLGCTLTGSTLTSAVSFPRPLARQHNADITEGDDLIQALKFLERYEEAQSNALNNMVVDDYPGYDDNKIMVPYDPQYIQYFDQGNDLSPPKFNSDNYLPDISYMNPYEQEIPLKGQGEEPPVQSLPRYTIGEQIERRLEFEELVDHLIQDAVIEEVLREDAQETAELLEKDFTEEDSSYNEEPRLDNDYSSLPGDSLPLVDDQDYDYSASSAQVLWNNVLENLTDADETSSEELSFQDDLGVIKDTGIDKDLLERVIQKIAEETMMEKLLDEQEPNNVEDINLPAQFDTELDNFVNKIMSELADGSENIANSILSEIDEEKELLETELNEEEFGSDSSFEEFDNVEAQNDPGVSFSNGWAPLTLDDEDTGSVEIYESCPALGYILEDCSIVDEFPGLGDGGYKQFFEVPCNRHQLCYLCSGTYDIPKDLCDDVYKMELISICSQDPECEFRSKYFWLSAVASRATFDSFLPVCREACVIEQFISN